MKSPACTLRNSSPIDPELKHGGGTSHGGGHRPEMISTAAGALAGAADSMSVTLPRAEDDSQCRCAAEVGEHLATLTLDDQGMICDCNRACERLFKYLRSELLGRPVSTLLPQLARLELMHNGQPSPRLRSLCRIGQHYPAVTQAGDFFAYKLYYGFQHASGPGVTLVVAPATAFSAINAAVQYMA